MVDGVCDARFAKVREVFASSFERGEEIGASFAVTLAGKSVIDLWGGYKDASKTNPWHDDTIVKVASTSKGITAFLAHMLMNEGR
ncbi:MAG: serine hydrolase domain-containing protein, partial [Pseudomonadota bacterium]|nr:serine hydrolase domain-containing protein [Pseudomonadota bacterium]